MRLRQLIDGEIARSPEGVGGAATSDDVKPPDPALVFPNEGKKPADEPAKAELAKADDKAKPAVADDAAAKEAAKAARKAELDKMSPEDRAKAEAADKAKEEAETWAAAVPEDGKYAPKMPEGVEIDQGMMDAFAPLFAEKKLSNGEVQKLTDRYIEQQQKAGEARQAQWSKTLEGWVEAAKSDEEIGGAKWDGTVKSVQGAVARFGTPALKEFLNQSGAGNHPEMIRMVARMSALIAEDKPASGGAVKPDASPETLMFPNDAKKGG